MNMFKDNAHFCTAAFSYFWIKSYNAVDFGYE